MGKHWEEALKIIYIILVSASWTDAHMRLVFSATGILSKPGMLLSYCNAWMVN